MPEEFYRILHIVGAFMLVAYTFRAFAAPDPATRKANLALGGFFSLCVLVGGFGLKARVGMADWPVWLIGKIVCWLLLSGPPARRC